MRGEENAVAPVVVSSFRCPLVSVIPQRQVSLCEKEHQGSGTSLPRWWKPFGMYGK